MFHYTGQQRPGRRTQITRPAPAPLRFILGAPQFAHDTLAMVEKLATRGGQPHAAGQTHQQWHAQFFLQRVDMARQRRLGHAQVLCGTGNATQFGDLDEITDTAQVHESPAPGAPAQG
jgi:hypothetical protein